jgi:hypothetical protein
VTVTLSAKKPTVTLTIREVNSDREPLQVWQVDLHWGDESSPGSEHTVGGSRQAGNLG